MMYMLMVHVSLPSKICWILEEKKLKIKKKKFKSKIVFYCRCAREVGVDRLIHLSAMNVTPDPIPKVYKSGSKWLKSKYWGEQAVFEEFPNANHHPASRYVRS